MIIEFDEKNVSEKIGNKAKSLIIMKAEGFLVPNGFVLDCDTYDQIIDSNEKKDIIDEILSQITKENISTKSSQLMALFDNMEVPEEVTLDIQKHLKPDKNYAVRSSGLKEDMKNFAFAGQYETFLNVRGIDKIHRAIINCYRSMYTEVALSYLLNNDIGTDNLKMSVIVQDMVNSDKSGVIFTVNPITGNDKEIVVEVAEGLGENIVGGRVNPERYIFNWFDEKYEIAKSNYLLEKNELDEILENALNIQRMYGFPCDIEFAIENENVQQSEITINNGRDKSSKVFILQARPITQIMYEGIPDQWTTADFKDGGVSATVCTPYMWSLYEYIWEYTLNKFLIESKILKEKDWRKAGEMFYGRPYWNLSIVKSAMEKVPGYKEREFDNELGIKITYKGDGTVTGINLKSIVGIIKMAIAQKKIVTHRRKNAETLKKELLEKFYAYESDSVKEYRVKEIESVWYKLIKEDYLFSESTYFWQIFINTIHQSLYKEKLLKHVSESQYFNLIGGLSNVSHLLPFYDIWKITRKIRKDKEIMKFWNENDISEIRKKYDECSKQYLLTDVREHIKKYGYHSKKELDVTYPCYSEDIDSVLEMFKETSELEEELSPQQDREHVTDVFNKQMESIKNKTNGRKYDKLKKKIDDMREMLWWREEFRDASTRFYYIIRLYTLKLAKEYVREGIINSEDEIWYTKIEDLTDYIDGNLSKEKLNDIIKRNRKYYDSFRNFMSENEIGAVFDKVDLEPQRNESHVKGLGCSNGSVTGTARVIESLAQIEHLQVGDILVTRYTDTGWTSKFSILKGIVTEYGGVLCHAAIVSREYGIPCVVCTHDATKLIKDGSTITINGTTGEIHIEKE